MKSTIRLFKAVPVKDKGAKLPSVKLFRETVKRGFIFSPKVIYNYSENELLRLADDIGLTPEQMNASFHKSWTKVKDASIEQLVIEQVIHYITTYGFEKLGVYDEQTVFIPCEKLEIPDIDADKISLTVIKGYTKSELKEKLLKLLQMGVALSEDTIKDVIDVATYVEITGDEVESIKNKEVRVTLYELLNLFPKEPIEFLRYIVYKSTNKALLIKDKSTIEEIKSKKNLDVLRLLTRYADENGLERLAEIFYRFKPIFLAFRTNSKLKSIVNRIRKLALRYHKPMKEDLLNSITSRIKKGESTAGLVEALKKANTFRKIRLAYALKFRTKNVESILYRIRNGKGYATGFQFSRKDKARFTLGVVLDSVAKDISKNVKKKKIYIPEHVEYALPATEKQFTGYFPSGTCISMPRDMLVGIHWDNQKRNRIDLDLSMLNAGEKLGWDGYYRNEDRTILFSGDMTDASKRTAGASELFYVKKQKAASYILFVNYFNYDEAIEVPFKIVVAKQLVKSFRKNYMIDPNNVMSVAETKIEQKQKILGLLAVTTNECKFYFTETYLGGSITASSSDFVEHSRKYLFDFYKNTISLRDVLERAGAKLVEDKEACDIDLSPEQLQKDTILNLLT